MILNLAAYNTSKRGTLDRVSYRFKREAMAVIKRHTSYMLPELTKALREEQPFSLNTSKLRSELEVVYLRHHLYTVHVGVSDGIREVSPDRKLSTWMHFDPDIAIEDTFTSLADKKDRDSITKRIQDRVARNAKKIAVQGASTEVREFLANLRFRFNRAADNFFKTPDDHTDIEAIKEVIRDVIRDTENASEARVERIFRTQTTEYFNEARVAYFQHETDVDFVQLFAVTDGRISNICESRHNYVIPIRMAGLKKFKPPFHPNCRTIQSPLMSDLKADADIIKRHLGAEFGIVHGDSSHQDFRGVRSPPRIPLPKNWS